MILGVLLTFAASLAATAATLGWNLYQSRKARLKEEREGSASERSALLSDSQKAAELVLAQLEKVYLARDEWYKERDSWIKERANYERQIIELQAEVARLNALVTFLKENEFR